MYSPFSSFFFEFYLFEREYRAPIILWLSQETLMPLKRLKGLSYVILKKP